MDKLIIFVCITLVRGSAIASGKCIESIARVWGGVCVYGCVGVWLTRESLSYEATIPLCLPVMAYQWPVFSGRVCEPTQENSEGG